VRVPRARLGEAVGAVRDALDPVAGQPQVGDAGLLRRPRRMAARAEVRYGARRAQHRAVHHLRARPGAGSRLS